MKYRKDVAGNRGFALLIVFILMSAVTIGLVMLVSNSFKGERSSKNVVTIDRMNTVAEALKKYYLGRHELPAIETGNKVPVGKLSLSTKYRFDGWGKFLHYNYDKSSILQGVAVDGKPMAAVLVSGGPNQDIEDGAKETWPKGTGFKYSGTGNDDIVVSVNLQSEAIEIATNTLHSLARKTCSYIYNNEDGAVDDDDHDVISEMIEQFSLNKSVYENDPWGNPNRWSDPDDDTSDYFHSFWSYGPNAIGGADGSDGRTDDIIVYVDTDDCTDDDDPPTLQVQFTFEFDTDPETDQIFKNDKKKHFPFPFMPGSKKGKYYIAIDQQDSKEKIHGVLYGNAQPIKYSTKPPHGSKPPHSTKPPHGLMPPHSTESPPTKSAGDYCVYFDGNGDYILMDPSSSFSFKEEFTLMAWCKKESKNNGHSWGHKDKPSLAMVVTAVNKNKSKYNGASYFLSIKEGSAIKKGKWNIKEDKSLDYPFGGVWDGDSILYQSLENKIEMNDNQWHHLALVFENGVEGSREASLKFYYEGEMEYEESGLKPIGREAFSEKIALYIAAGICAEKNHGKHIFIKKDEACDFFQGWVDNVNFYATVLTKEQIVAEMKGE